MGSENDNQYGMKVLFDGTDPTVDVVAVHGLDGHPELTWTAKNGALWLRDYLPERIPNLRILSYGYDGRTNGSGFSCQNLYDHAIGLVTELTLYRNRTKTNERPIIFIAHDIGGLIVKDALIYSNSANETNLEHHHTIKTCTYGILFLGTPHQGSDILASLKKKNQAISTNLKENSELLQRQLGQYNSISSHFVTKCFYETNKSQSRKEATIGASAARIPGATNVEVYSINSDHEGMVKYNSAENDGYNKVSGCLKLMVDDAPEQVLERWSQWNRIKAARMNGVQITFEIPFEPEYPRNQHFTGRKDLLDRLHHTIREAEPRLVTVVLYGTGGIGKTQIVSEYAHAHQKEYDSIFWISCVTKESIQRGFRAVAQRLVVEHANIAYDTSPNYAVIAKHLNMSGVVDENGLVSTSEDHIQYIIRGINLWLTKEGNKKWLLIFDNVDPKNTDIKTFLPVAPYGTVIITSRRTECRLFGTALLVEEMQEQEAQDLLLKSAVLTEDPTAGEVVKKLGSLPLAIVQAGAYVAMCEISFTRYLEIYEKCFNRIFAENPPTSHYGDRTVLTTWEISYQAIKETDRRAAELLSLCSFLSNEDISDDMIRRGKRLEKDDITLDNQLGLLFSYSLAQRKGHFDSFNIHPVVHLWAHERLNDPNRVWNTKGALEIITTAVRDPNLTPMEKINFEGRSLQHAMIIAKNVMRYLIGLRGLMDESLIHRMVTLGLVLSSRGQLRDAEDLQLTALEVAQDILGKEHLGTLTAMSNLALTYDNQGRHKEAEVLQLEVLEVGRRTLGKEHPNTLAAMGNLASTYVHQGQYKEVEVLQLEVLQLSQRIRGKENQSTLKAMNNLATTYMHQGRHREAEVLQLEVLEAEQRILGKEHPDTLTSMSNLASIYGSQGQHKEAEGMQLDALEVKQRILGKEHPDALTSMNSLATNYTRQGRYKEAEVLQLEVLQVSQRILGKEHPDTLAAMNNLATIYVHQGQYKEAEVLQLEVLQVSQRILGKEHPDTLAAMNNLATIYVHQGQYKEAEVLQLEVLEVGRRTLGKEHLGTLAAMNNLASTYVHQGQYKEAEVLQLESLQVSQRILGKGHPDTLTVMENLALIYEGQGRHKEAEVLLLEVLQVSQRILGKERPDTLAAMNNLASTYVHQGQYKEAEVLQLEVLEVGRRTLGKEHLGTLAAMNNLASTYVHQGQYKEAEVLQLEVLQVLQRILGKEHPDTLTVMSNLATTYMHQGRHKDAELLGLEAIEISQRVLGEMNPITLQLTANLAALQERESNTEYLLGQLDTLMDEQDDVMLKIAIEMSLQSDRPEEGSGGGSLGKNDPFTTVNKLAITLGENHPVTLCAMSNLAGTFCEKELWQEAEKLQLVVTDRTQKTLGNEHINTLRSKLNLAGNYIQQDRYNEAEALLLPTVEVMKHTLGRDHEDTITTMKTLAVVYSAQGRRKEAMELAEKIENTDLELVEEAIRLSLSSESDGAGGGKGERKLDKKEPDPLKTMANQAATYWNLGEWDEAERLELEVMNSRRMILSKEDASTLLSMTNLAATYREQERWKDAEALELQVMKSRMKSLGNKHLDTLIAMSNLAGTYTDQKRWDEAGELYTKVAMARIESLGKEDPRTLSAMAALATNHWNKGELDKAEKLELKVVESRRKVFGNDNPDTIAAVSNLAATYASQSRYDEAEELQEEVLCLLVKTRGSKYFETVLARELVELYHEGRMREQLQQQAAARVFSPTPNVVISFVIIFLFMCSFVISFSCRLFSYFISYFLPTFQFPIWSNEGIIQTLRERVTGMVRLEKYTKDERSGRWVRER